MRAIHCLSLLLALAAPLASADGLYQVEMILIRQNAVPAQASAPAPAHWREGATPLAADAERPARLNGELERLQGNPEYSVLLHKSWEQSLGPQPSLIALSGGESTYGRFPIEGTLSLTEGRFIAAQARFWVNQLDGNGRVIESEQFRQSNANVKRAQLNFLDGGHLALLLKVSPVGGRQPAPVDTELLEQ
ncbi:CsiV family protein [Pseudomonas cremoricolorata]|uniref:CsiV family protein n=1 Tax=Pseudomonas cremoricolorata TaxID=157783 RepID=UPI00041C1B3E|nr:CsiV family protein [Pseudomonas cremoricolorata]